MISSSREKGIVEAKEEGESNDQKLIPNSKGSFPLPLPLPLASSSRQWSGLRNPRIVRVSRSFGGKDRHSKVCTIRGLRDRRIRLSVPTAIQLYDLQDRLGLSQPSKVIDWLLDNTKNDIDKLPPLQMPQNFGHFHHHHLHPSPPDNNPFFDSNSMMIRVGDADAVDMRAKNKQIETESLSKGKWVENEETQDGNAIGDYGGAMPFNSFFHLDPSTLSLSQFGHHNQFGYLSAQPPTDNFLNSNNSSVVSAATNATQLFFCPPSTMPPLFPTFAPYANVPMPIAPVGDSSDSVRQINYFQLLNSNSSQHVLPHSVDMKPFSLNVNAANDDDRSRADDAENADS